MSRSREDFTHLQDRNYYFDENAKIWYTEDGSAVTILYLASLQNKVRLLLHVFHTKASIDHLLVL